MKKSFAIFVILCIAIFAFTGELYSQATLETAQPFCTAVGATYPAGVNTGTAQPGPNYGCLIMRPNPAWYYMKIGVGGSLQITETNSANVDIDFILWGPFPNQSPAPTDLTAGKMIDCSYHPQATEVIDLGSSSVGEYYILLVTNFSNSPTNITLAKTGGTGETDCSIVNPAPPTPGLASPGNGSTNQPLTLNLCWDASTGATSYGLQVATDAGFSNLVYNQTGLAGLCQQVGPLNTNTTFYWRANATNANGTSAWSGGWSFTTVPPVPSAPTLVSPADNAINQPLTLTLTWNASSGATSYRLQVASDAGFTNLVVNEANITTTSRQVGPLNNSIRYFWRVNATNAGGTSAYSSVRRFRALNPAPATYLTTSAGVSTYYAMNGPNITVDGGVTVSGGNYDGAIVSINTNFTSAEDRLIYPTVLHEITGDYNTSTGVLTFTGNGTGAQYQEVLRSVQYKNINVLNPSQATRQITFQVGTAIFYSGSGHYYRYVPASAIRWDVAKNQADVSYFYGLAGYLTTITSAGENSFIQQKINGNTWIGGTCDPAFAPGAFWPPPGITTGSIWKWATGPEYLDNLSYINWAPGEPNNSGGEAHLHLYSTGLWNDFAIDNPNILGYLIEYGGLAGDPTVTISGDKNLAVYIIPPPTLLSPANNSIYMEVNQNLSWQEVPGAELYQIQLAVDENFTIIVLDDATVGGFCKQVGPLNLGTKYYWRVRALRAGARSLWSTTWNFTTLPTVPPQPILILPENNSVDRPITLNLSWNPAPNALTYRLQVATDSNFNNLVFNDSTLTATNHDVGPLSNFTRYYWRVNAKSCCGTSVWSPTWTYRTIVPFPVVPTGTVTPTSGAINQPITLNISWQPVPYAETYRLQVSTSNTFGTTVFDDSTITTTSKQVGPLANDKTYYWRVRAKNVAGTGAYSTISVFTTIVPIPVTPSLGTPANNAVRQPMTITLTWAEVPYAVKYRLQVATDSLFTVVSVFLDDTTLTTNSRQVTLPSYDTKYFWRVNAKNIAGTGTFSSIRSFRTLGPIPTVFDLSNPLEHHRIVVRQGDGTPITFKWRKSTYATKYRWRYGVPYINPWYFDILSNSNGTDTLLTLTEGQLYNIWDSTMLLGSIDSCIGQWAVWAFNVYGLDSTQSNQTWYLKFVLRRTTGFIDGSIPTEYSLAQNYPNPFNPSTKLRFGLPQESNVTLTIYNILGEQVDKLINNDLLKAGWYEYDFNASKLPSGNYIYRITAGNFTQTKKMSIIK